MSILNIKGIKKIGVLVILVLAFASVGSFQYSISQEINPSNATGTNPSNGTSSLKSLSLNSPERYYLVNDSIFVYGILLDADQSVANQAMEIKSLLNGSEYY
ncbi:MAG TPA: hypothetical protein VIA09_03085, partial [Nitrososphaeraceae archaeon]